MYSLKNFPCNIGFDFAKHKHLCYGTIHFKKYMCILSVLCMVMKFVCALLECLFGLIICFDYPAATCPLVQAVVFDQSILGMTSQSLISLAVF